MLEVRFYRDGQGRLAAISAAGHADFADYGDDIVCAAVAAVLQAARLGLSQVARCAIVVKQEPGCLEVAWPQAERGGERLTAIAETAELAVEQIARQYPAQVRIFRAPWAEPTGAADRERVSEFADQRRVDDV